ncbi:phosphate-selective porin OprO and OprP [Gammaproteobacteria bacterium]
MKKQTLVFLTALIISPIAVSRGILAYTPKGLTFSFPNSDFSTSLSGLIQADAMNFAQNNQDLSSGTNLKRAQLYLNGQLISSWNYNLGYDFRANNLLLAQVQYSGWKGMQLSVGQVCPSFSISNDSDNDSLDTLELPLPVSAFSPPLSYYVGVRYNVWSDFLTFKLSAFGPSSSQKTRDRTPQARSRTTLGSTARLVYSPIHTETRMFDLGLSVWAERPDGSNSFIVSSIPEIQSHTSNKIVNSGTISNVNNYGSVDAEMAAIYGPWSTQMEYLQMRVNRSNNNPNLKFSGYSLAGSYFLTGESLAYSFPDAYFEGNIDIHNKKLGAWEVLARYSTVNLGDADIAGGKENNMTLGLNWYLNRHVKFLINYVYAMAKPGSNGKNDNVNSIAARMQLVF